MTQRGVPGLYIDADMREGIEATSFLSEYMVRTSTQAHLKTVVSATHSVFAKRFDDHMSHLAKTNPENYFHVYEYSASGDGFRWVSMGDQRYQLWQHTRIHQAGSALNFSWRWLPAKNNNPDYRQRRRSTVGWDALREVDADTFADLMAGSSSQGKGYKYVWKAPMLEYGIRTNIVARRRALWMPVSDLGVSAGKGKAGGAQVLFRRFANTEWQWPGSTRGNFTEAWATFWGAAEGDVERVMGEEIEKDAKMRIEAALKAGKKAPRARTRTFAATAVTDIREAQEAGREQAISAVRLHGKSIKQIEAGRGIRSF